MERALLRKVAVACCGSVAVYSIPNLIVLLRRAYDCELHVFLSQNAQKFLNPVGLSALTGKRVFAEVEDKLTDEQLLDIISGSNITLVAPITANTIARLASGCFESLVARVATLADGPVLIAPAMNQFMWEHPATQRNVDAIVGASVAIVGPSAGLEVATFEPSISSMASIDEIIEKMIELSR